jgi:hypothetical protein
MQIMVQHPRLGLVDSAVFRLDKTVNEYDAKLHLDRHPETGDWAVYIDMERPQPPYPVLGLGKTLPTTDQLLQKLRESDSQRHDIRKKINEANEAHMREIDRKSRDEVGKAAEVTEWLARAQGMRPDNQSRRKFSNQ